MGDGAFAGVPSGFTVYYSNIAIGFDTPDWQAFPAVVLKAQYLVFLQTPKLYFGHGPQSLQPFRQAVFVTGNSYQPIVISVVSGPVFISGENLVFTGAGRITLRYDNFGDTVYAPCSATRSYDVLMPYTYTVVGGGVTITGYSGPGGAVTLLDHINGLPVVGIGDFAFYSATNLNGLVIPEGITTIGQGAFSGCSGLSSVNLPASLVTIGEEAFGYCPALTSFTVSAASPNFATREGLLFDRSFQTLLRAPPASILGVYNVPNGVTSIAPGAFSECFLIKGVNIPESVVIIGANAFGYCVSLREFVVASNNPAYASEGGALFDKSRLVLLSVALAAVGEAYVVPAHVAVIGESAFLGCFGLKTVTLPDGLIIIGPTAFADCSELVAVRIPAGVLAVDNAAFYGCGKLTEARFLGNAPSMGWSVFGGAAASFSVFYQFGATGFSSPTWTTGSFESLRSIALKHVDFGHFAATGGLTGASAAPDADADHDGLPNLLEFAFGSLSVNGGDEVSIPQASILAVGGEPSLAYVHRRRKNSGLRFVYKTCSDLGSTPSTWVTANVVPKVVNPDVDGDGQVELVLVTWPFIGVQRLFVALSVSE